mmetsp:Transcript_12944/g.9376  ORF Transcript_12944/g.9376 Transcript_12944/m.9376 type:complete len:279 (+) Transcript_12944:30-866(+)
MQYANQAPVEETFHFLDLNKTAPLPEDFIVIGCCALRCTNFEFKQCFGAKSTTQCLCIEDETQCCKFIDENPDVCFVCGTGACECVAPTGICKIYRQLFCCELVLGCPVQEAYFNTPLDISKTASRKSSAKDSEIIPCSAGYCDFSSFYCKWPECCGIYRKSVCLCLTSEMVAYKPFFAIPNLPKQNLLCLCYQGNALCVPIKTCVKSQSQTCCIEYRCAFPCDDEVPCICMPIIFCTCCVNGQCYCGCCQTLEQIKYRGMPPPQANPTVAQPAPASY